MISQVPRRPRPVHHPAELVRKSAPHPCSQQFPKFHDVPDPFIIPPDSDPLTVQRAQVLDNRYRKIVYKAALNLETYGLSRSTEKILLLQTLSTTSTVRGDGEVDEGGLRRRGK